MDSVNFPAHLRITPSSFAGSLRDAGLSLVRHGNPMARCGDGIEEGLFGDAAQRDAIQKYGIAGRVWEAAYALCLYIKPPTSLQFDPPFIQGAHEHEQLTVLELGSGSGRVTIEIASSLDPSRDMLLATDLPEVCPLLESNISAANLIRTTNSPHTPVLIKPLSWGNTQHASDISSQCLQDPSSSKSPRHLSHIICSDLVYFPELLAPLLRTLLQITSPPFCQDTNPENGPTVIISYKIRSLSKEAPFWSAFGLWFTFEPVLFRQVQEMQVHPDAGALSAGDDTPDGAAQQPRTIAAGDQPWRRFGSSAEDAMFIFIAKRRKESFAWRIPNDDRDLLLGRGARGDDSAKSDDTFETLLLMSLEDS